MLNVWMLARLLNEATFSALHYQAPGTDLTLGLPKSHVWESRCYQSQKVKASFLICQQKKVFTGTRFRVRADGLCLKVPKPLSLQMAILLRESKVTFQRR